MWAYIIRRILWTIPIVLGVVVITFVLFSVVAKDPARQYAGKFATRESLSAVRAKMGLDKPRWVKFDIPLKSVVLTDGILKITTRWPHGLLANDHVTIQNLAPTFDGKFAVASVIDSHALSIVSPGQTLPTEIPESACLHPASFKRAVSNMLDEPLNTQLFDVILFRFPESMHWEASLGELVKRKAPASMAIQIPAFLITLGLELSLALFVAAKRGRWQDYTITFLAVLGMSVPALSVYIAAQWLLGRHWGVFPVAGWEVGWQAIHFAALPILVSVIVAIGGGTRFYRTVMLEEVNTDYVRTARAKGVAGRDVYFTHVLRNAMIPVITNTVTALPGLVLGALLLERIFQVPGLGNLMVEALGNNDRSIVMAMTYILSIVYCGLLLLTDICYAMVDPRVSLK